MKKNFDLKKTIKIILGLGSALFVIANIIIANQAYHFTRFSSSSEPKTEISEVRNIKTIIKGINIPHPKTQKYPDIPYDSVQIQSGDHILEAWLIKPQNKKKSKGTIIYFHGYTAEKSQMLDYAYATLEMGYNAMLVDFRGAGHSSGNQTTFGYMESEDVKAATLYVQQEIKSPKLFLFGFSMGAAAVTKAQHDYTLPVDGIILEAPYASFRGTIKNRARLMGAGVLANISSYLFTFWVGATNFFDPFDMNPDEFVKNIHVPALIACGDKDQYVSTGEIERIFNNLNSEKKALKFYIGAEHETYIQKHHDEWIASISSFLNQ